MMQKLARTENVIAEKEPVAGRLGKEEVSNIYS
jgi:hypothetical protein